MLENVVDQVPSLAVQSCHAATCELSTLSITRASIPLGLSRYVPSKVTEAVVPPAAVWYTLRLNFSVIETGCPVHILQGMEDPDVPYAHALNLIEHLPAEDVVLTLVRDGDHRLSRPQDIELMLDTVDRMVT